MLGRVGDAYTISKVPQKAISKRNCGYLDSNAEQFVRFLTAARYSEIKARAVRGTSVSIASITKKFDEYLEYKTKVFDNPMYANVDSFYHKIMNSYMHAKYRTKSGGPWMLFSERPDTKKLTYKNDGRAAYAQPANQYFVREMICAYSHCADGK